MKLDFHYFTVKFIASRCGYSEQEAQFIATACQFINDNHQDWALYLPKDQISEAIKNRNLYENDPSKGPNMCKVPLLLSALKDENNFAELESLSNQIDILIPFYYFCDAVVVEKEKEITINTEYRVSPIQTLQSNKTFNLLFQRAADKYRTNLKNKDGTPAVIHALRRLGILLHIASDSFVYVPFNGSNSQVKDKVDVNEWIIKEVLDSRTLKNITDQYEPQKYEAYPHVGKFRTGHVCDDYNVQFILYKKKSPGSYTRINNDYFAKAAKAVYEFLSNFSGKEPSEQDWRNNLLPTLLKGWNTDARSYEDLKRHWSSLSSVNYEYDEDAVRQSIVDIDKNLKPEQQGYYDFLLMIQDVRDAVKGKLKGASYMFTAKSWSTDAITCDMSDPIFSGDSYHQTISVSLPTKLELLTMSVKIFDVDTQEQIASKAFTYKNSKTINEKITLTIPEQNQNLLANIELTWQDDKGPGKKSFSKEYSIIGNAAIIVQQELLAPCSKSGRVAIQIVNGSESISADYNYPLNAMYISQEGIAQLDLYTPIELQWKLADGFEMIDYQNLSISMKLPSGQVLKYCNNSKFVDLKWDQSTGLVHLQVIDEWKNRLSVKDFSASIAKMKLEVRVTLEVSSDHEDGYRNIVVNTGTDDTLVAAVEYLWNL